MRIRPATPGDAGALAAIYAHHVLHGTGTFEETPPGAQEMGRRVAAVQTRGWPWLVAERDGHLLGYAYAGQYRDRIGYRFAAESSVYVRHDEAGRGVGRALLGALIDAAAHAGFRRMIAVIGDAANAGSIGLHAAFGFAPAGQLTAVGFKFGRWVDVVFMERAIGETA